MIWQQLKIQTDESHAEEISELMFAQGASAVHLENAAGLPSNERAAEMAEAWKYFQVVGLFDEKTDLEVIVKVIQDIVDENVIRSYRIEALPDQKWELAWRKYFRPMRFGKSLWVCPTGEESEDPQAICVVLEPGMGFGTGAHPSTALCLEWLDEHPPYHKHVIDYGCGSGVLSIAAIKLGAAQVWAVDIDPDALRDVQENLARNALSQMQVKTALPEDRIFKETNINQPADLLIANIMAYPLIDLASDFATYVKPAGRVVLSGILSEQTDRLQNAYEKDFVFVTEKVFEGWTRLEFKKKG